MAVGVGVLLREHHNHINVQAWSMTMSITTPIPIININTKRKSWDPTLIGIGICRCNMIMDMCRTCIIDTSISKMPERLSPNIVDGSIKEPFELLSNGHFKIFLSPQDVSAFVW